MYVHKQTFITIVAIETSFNYEYECFIHVHMQYKTIDIIANKRCVLLNIAPNIVESKYDPNYFSSLGNLILGMTVTFWISNINEAWNFSECKKQGCKINDKWKNTFGTLKLECTLFLTFMYIHICCRIKFYDADAH